MYLILTLQLNTGLRIGDVLALKRKNLSDGVLNIREEKTGKKQYRKLNSDVISIVERYCSNNNICREDNLFDVKVRWVQKYLHKVSAIMNLHGVSTHSFRKTYAHFQYLNNDCNIELVRRLLNHSSIVVTQRYLGITDYEVNKASEEFKIIY